MPQFSGLQDKSRPNFAAIALWANIFVAICFQLTDKLIGNTRS